MSLHQEGQRSACLHILRGGMEGSRGETPSVFLAVPPREPCSTRFPHCEKHKAPGLLQLQMFAPRHLLYDISSLMADDPQWTL